MSVPIDDDAFYEKLEKKENRLFLRKLYEDSRNSRKRAKILNGATKENLDVCIETLCHILHGNIHIKEHHVADIKKAKIMTYLHKTFKEEADCKKLIKSSTKNKVSVLKKVSTFHRLFFLLFNDP